MTRIYSLFGATALAMLPLGAFAHGSSTAPAKAPSQMGSSVSPATSAPGQTTAAVPNAKTRVQHKRQTGMQSQNHHDKTIPPVKMAVPSKS